MQRSMVSKTLASSSHRIICPTTSRALPSSNPKSSPYDVFINHRGVDTKRTIAGLLFQHLSSVGVSPFLDNKSMKPGDKLLESINSAIKGCRVGIAVFSPNYCESYYCLHELALMMECRKKVVPIFCDVKPSELRVQPNEGYSPRELEKFQKAIEDARGTVGLTFDTSKGDWSEFLTRATETIFQTLHEGEEETKHLTNKITKYYENFS